MPSWLRAKSGPKQEDVRGATLVCAVIILLSFSAWVSAKDYSARVHSVEIIPTEDKSEVVGYRFNADIDYVLSPVAKEALQNGIAFTWRVIIQVQQPGFFWDKTLYEQEIGYQIKSHKLLNLYSVKNTKNQSIDMFSSIAAAFNFISKIRSFALIDQYFLQKNTPYQVAIKVLFDREALPVPLRPMSYLNSEWDLSSQWTVWPLQN